MLRPTGSPAGSADREKSRLNSTLSYRPAVMAAYPKGQFPVFEGYDHMQYQIRDPEGFAAMLISVMETGKLPELPVLRREEP